MSILELCSVSLFLNGAVGEVQQETCVRWEWDAVLMGWAGRIMGNSGCAYSWVLIAEWFVCFIVRRRTRHH